MFLAGNAPLLVVGAVVNCVGTGMLLPALLTSALSRLSFANRGRGTGLWTAAFFGGEFLCPLVLLAAEVGVGSLAGAVSVLGLTTAAVAAGLWESHRKAAATRLVRCRNGWGEAAHLPCRIPAPLHGEGTRCLRRCCFPARRTGRASPVSPNLSTSPACCSSSPRSTASFATGSEFIGDGACGSAARFPTTAGESVAGQATVVLG